MKAVIVFCLLNILYTALYSQKTGRKIFQDTLPVKTLDSVVVIGSMKISDASFMEDIEDMHIYSGKRTNTLELSDKVPGLSQNTGRTVFAKIPGLTMWEMDGAGTQINIGSRGTDPHRSIEMNMRQNGYVTNSDAFGYPENHYTVPLQAVEEIQLVRGSAALQFGPQFGGMMNYKLKHGDSTKILSVESEQTVGSNNFFNSFNAVGGTAGRFNYYAFYDNRHGDGWREQSRFNYQSYHVHLNFKVNEKMNLSAEFSRMKYVQQIAGGLTDQQFHENPRFAVRARNYFQPVINIPAFIFRYKFTPHTELRIISHAILGQRNSVQFIHAGNIPDTFNTVIGSYNPRQVDRDYYTGFTTEANILHSYQIGSIKTVVSGGVRYFTQLTKRRQKGIGTSGSDFDLSLTGGYGIDLRLKTQNVAVFAENTFHITPEFSITPGWRIEHIRTSLAGVIQNAGVPVAYSGIRNMPLFGSGFQYLLNNSSQLYANISQAYRPYLYAFVTPADRVDKIDPSLKDSKGFNIDLGYRGHYRNLLQFDINAFYLFYGNRIGLLAKQTTAGDPYLLTTNIGNSVAKGMEIFAELSLWKLIDPKTLDRDLKLFTSSAFNDARYRRTSIGNAGQNKPITGNFIENAPRWISKSGVQFRFKELTAEFQYSYTGKSFNDALNTESSLNGITGAIPAYHVWDLYFNWEFLGHYHISLAVNNLADERYFNRRITFYPGPGILPADGRTCQLSFGVKW